MFKFALLGSLLLCLRVVAGDPDVYSDTFKWKAYALTHFVKGENVGPYVYKTSTFDLLNSEFFTDGKLTGMVQDCYETTGQKGGADVSIYETPSDGVDLHQVARLLLLSATKDERLQIKDTANGRILIMERIVDAPDVKISIYAWRVDARHAVMVGMYSSGTAPLSLKIFDYYAKRFPPQSFDQKEGDIDKTQWGRDETEFWLQQLKSSLNDKTNLDDVSSKAAIYWMPLYVPPIIQQRSPTLRPRSYDEMFKWWAENKEKTVWDDKKHVLYEPGKSEADMEKLAREADEVSLMTPMTDAEVKAASEQVAAVFETKFKKDVSEYPKEANVKFEKVGEGKWLLSKPSPDGKYVIHMIYSGPVIQRRPREFTHAPLAAIFALHWEDIDENDKLRINDSEYSMLYHRLEKAWK